MFKKISEARYLFASLADCAHVKANHCAHGPNNCQQNCLCHLNIVIWAQIQTWNLSILVHLRIISDLTHLLLDHVLYNTLFEFFRFTKKYVSPVVLTLLLHLVCKYCVHFSQPCQEVGQIAGPCQPMFRNTIFPAFNEKKSVADVIVQTISNLKVCLLRSLWSIQYEKLPSQFEMRLFLRTVSPCCQWHEGDVWPEAWCGAMRGIIKVRTGSNPASDWTDYEPCSG